MSALISLQIKNQSRCIDGNSFANKIAKCYQIILRIKKVYIIESAAFFLSRGVYRKK